MRYVFSFLIGGTFGMVVMALLQMSKISDLYRKIAYWKELYYNVKGE